MTERFVCRLAAVAFVTLAAPTFAQTPPDDHAKHHPAPADSQPSSAGAGSSLPGAPVAGMSAGMEEMMKQMGRPAPAELFPTLMNVPALSPDQRAALVRRARDQMEAGQAQLLDATERMSAAARDDYAALQAATRQAREATALFESGLAAQRALAEGRPPRNIALPWFRREMNLASPALSGGRRTILGVAPFHLFTMVLLVAFAVAMLALYYARMRRAAALFGRLDPDTDPPPGAAAPPAGDPASSAPTAVPTGGRSPLAVPTSPGAPSAGTEVEAPSGADTTSAAPVTANWRGRLRVASIVAETPSVKTFRLVPASGEPVLPFTFVPGQFLNVTFWIGGARMHRSYSISSSPTERAYVELTIRREPRGAVSRHTNDLLKIGDQIEVAGPVGRFTFTGTEADSIVLVSGGVGITPMMSITRWLTEQSWPGHIFFVYACRTPADFIFANEIAALERRNPKLYVAAIVESANGTDWAGPRGRITKDWLAETVPDLASRRVHLCGPPAMMAATRAALLELGVPAAQVKTELFGTPKPVPAPSVSSAAATTPATGPMVTFSKNNKSARIHVDQTVLELSEELDIGIEYSCRVGTCGVCKVQTTSGEVEMAVEDALGPGDKAGGVILACQAKPVTDVAVAA